MSSSIRKRTRRFLGTLFLGLGLLAGSVPAVRAQAAAAQPAQIAHCFVKSPYFELPLNIGEQARAAARELRLYCKPSPTSAWVLLQKAPPTQSKFSFHAAREGEYLFTITMMDQAGRETPSDPDKASFRLAVVVDLQPPQADVQFVGKCPQGFDIQVDVRDANLDPTKTQVLYQTKDQAWRPIESVRGNRCTLPIQAALTGMVRVYAADMSGNVTQRDFDLSTHVGATTTARAPAAIPTPVVTDPSVNVVPITNISVTPVEATVGSPMPAPTRAGSVSDGPAPTRAGSVSDGPAPTPTTQPDTGIPPPSSYAPVGPNMPTVTNSFSAANRAEQNVSDNFPPLPMPRQEPSETVKTAVGGQGVGGVNRHLVNHRQLLMAYKIEQVGRSGVGKVEVWITSDQSKTWQRLGEDTECKGSVAIELPGEGLYGVTLVVSNGRGYGANPPRSGDAPDAWVEVDTTRPVVDFTNIRAGTGNDAGSIYVSWLAQDRNLAADAVELYFATSRDSAWQPIAKGLKNEGRYRWSPPAGVGAQVYLRLVAHDLAGNTAVVESPQAVALDDSSRPRGRLVGISPCEPEAHLEPMGMGN